MTCMLFVHVRIRLRIRTGVLAIYITYMRNGITTADKSIDFGAGAERIKISSDISSSADNTMSNPGDKA